MAYAVRQQATLAWAQISATAAHNMAIVGAQTLIAPMAVRMPLVLAR
jgi:hypothetical protein